MLGQVTSASARNGRHWGPALSLFFYSVAICCIAAGGASLWLHWQGNTIVAFRPAAGINQILLGAAQGKLLIGRKGRLPDAVSLRWFQRTMLIGFAGCYVMALWLGSGPTAPYLFGTALAAWHTVMIVMITVDARHLESALRVFRHRSVRVVVRGLYLMVLATLVVELGLRLYWSTSDGPLTEAHVAQFCSLDPGSEYQGRRVNALGYWDDEFHTARDGAGFRVAVLGDRVTLSGTTETNFLSQVEQQVPNLEVYNFGLPEAGPAEYAAQAARQIVRYQPDLLLVVVSVDDDISMVAPAASAFQWQSLRICQIGAHVLSGSPQPTIANQTSPEGRLRCSHLAVCRTPIDARMHAQWKSAQGHLAGIIKRCRDRGIDVALVLAPGEFQVSSTLRDVLCRRAGCEPGQLDLELPQRRLSDFAAERDTPVLDLLPHFRTQEAPLFRRDGLSWNDRGNQLAAQVLGTWLRDRYAPQIAARR